MYNLNKSIIFVLSLAIIGCAAPTKLPGNTIATGRLANDAVGNLNMLGAGKYNCGNLQVINTKAIKTEGELNTDSLGRLVSGNIIEEWEVNHCGTVKTYNITFIPDGNGGNYIKLELIDKPSS